MCFVLFQQKAYSQDWFGKIIPLQTTKQEIEKIIPINPSEESPSENSHIYILKDWTVFIDFSPGRCISEKYEKWDIETGVVINVFYTTRIDKLEDWVKFSLLEKDIRGFKKGKLDDYTYYTNLEKGIVYRTFAGRVQTFTYFIPPEKQKFLKCKN